MIEELPERLPVEVSETFRPANEGAEKWLYRPIKCLDYGFVYLVDYMGSDSSVVQAARVSYGIGTKKASSDRGLIRYLRRHMHTTPFEMVEFSFHCKLPIFVARQWIRHRTANVNEYSGRYSEMLNEFYIPDPSVLHKQSRINKQGRADALSSDEQARVLELLKIDYQSVYGHYQEFLQMDLARELARIGLSVANYTQWYWKIDLHNLIHFLNLRLDPHAQYEIRVFAEAMARMVKDAVPISFEAFEDYQLHAMKLSRLEIEVLKGYRWPMAKQLVLELLVQIENKREREECLEKLEKLGFIV